MIKIKNIKNFDKKIKNYFFLYKKDHDIRIDRIKKCQDIRSI